jgi:hypothetical protein
VSVVACLVFEVFRFLALRDDQIKRSQRGYKWLTRRASTALSRYSNPNINSPSTNIIPIHSRKLDRAHSALHPTAVLRSPSDPCAWPLRRYHDAHGAVRTMNTPTRPSHAHQALLISPPTHVYPTVLIVEKHPKDVRFSLDSLDRWQYSSSSQCRNLVTYKSECHHYISRSMSFFDQGLFPPRQNKGKLTW